MKILKSVTISFQNNEIILRPFDEGDTFYGETATQVLHSFNRLKLNTFLERYNFFKNYVSKTISLRTGVTYLWNWRVK